MHESMRSMQIQTSTGHRAVENINIIRCCSSKAAPRALALNHQPRHKRELIVEAAVAESSGNTADRTGPLLLDSVRRSFSTRQAVHHRNRTDGPRVCVLGAGVNGLATAVRLLEVLPSAQITIYADKFGSDLTSHGAAGVWMPYKLSETPEVLTHRWGKETFGHLMSLVHSDQAVQAGVQLMYTHSLFLAEEPDPFWADTVHGFKRMSKDELQLFSSTVDWQSIQAAAAAAAAAANSVSDNGSSAPGDGSIDSYTAAEHATCFEDGYAFNTVVCEGRLYMRWLSSKLEAAGVSQTQRKLTTLAELAGEQWDVVINCCGLGSKTLLPDPHCYPIRGQIMRVRAPWVNQCVFADFADHSMYIIPNREWVVLGGTGQIGNSNTDMSLLDAERIADRAIQVLPSLKHAEVLDHWVGLRPGRVRLRLECETMSAEVLTEAAEATGVELGSRGKVEELRVVHNYGHGGSGLTLAWGTAGDAVQLALQMLQHPEEAKVAAASG